MSDTNGSKASDESLTDSLIDAVNVDSNSDSDDALGAPEGDDSAAGVTAVGGVTKPEGDEH